MPGGYESIPIPDIGLWKVTMWHFGVDTPSYKEVNCCITWKDVQGVLLREYSKKKEGKLRKERQEYPNISFDKVQKRAANISQSEIEPKSVQKVRLTDREEQWLTENKNNLSQGGVRKRVG